MFSIDFLGDEFYIIVEAEDAGDEQEGLGDIDQQTVGHVVDHDDLISHQRNAAHDEQHRTGILRDFESRVFHSRQITVLLFNFFSFPVFAEQKVNDGTQDLQNDFPCLVHNRVF